MVKSIRYIFTRIIIGVGIAIALMIIKGNLLMQVNAQSIWTADLNLTSMHYMNKLNQESFNDFEHVYHFLCIINKLSL